MGLSVARLRTRIPLARTCALDPGPVPDSPLPAHAWSQQTTLAPTLTQIVSSGAGIARDCDQSEYSTGLGLELELPVMTRWTSLQVAGRAYGIDLASECDSGFPPPDGTYIENDRVDLLSRPFVATDVRLAARTGEPDVLRGRRGHGLAREP